jgi:hypothetical protein
MTECVDCGKPVAPGDEHWRVYPGQANERAFRPYETVRCGSCMAQAEAFWARPGNREEGER